MSELKKIIAEHLGQKTEDVTSEKHLTDDLRADSLDMVEIAMAIEDHFGFEIPDSDIDKWSTVGDVEEYVLENSPKPD